MTTEQTMVQDSQDATVTQAQILENRMITDGVLRYEHAEDRNRRNNGVNKAEMKVLASSVPCVAAEIVKMLKDAEDVRKANPRARVPGWVIPLSMLDPQVVAVIAIRNCFQAVMRGYTLMQASKYIGLDCETEVWALGFHITKPDVFDRLCKMAVKNHDSVQFRKQAVTAVAGREGYPLVHWEETFTINMGAAILNAVLVSNANIFETEDTQVTLTEKKKRLVLTKGAAAALEELDSMYSIMRPKYMPTLKAPKPWVSMDTGCYDDPRLSSTLQFVKSHCKVSIDHVTQAFNNGSIGPVRDAVNAIQAVPLSINVLVLQVLTVCLNNGIHVTGLPKARMKMPEKCHPVQWRIMPKEEKDRHKKLRREILIKNRGAESDRMQLSQDLGVALELSGQPEFYSPSNLDFRGRVYTVASFNHQRGDHIRALFQFANGKPLGATGPRWLAIHIANTGDFDKVSKKSFDEREQWTLDHSADILAIAADPIGTIDQWSKADKPFCYLAGCFEWSGYMREGPGFISHLPIALDGSNSGVQHYSAAMRSPEGSLVNLTPAPVPSDVYQAVADLVWQQVCTDYQDPTDAKVKMVSTQWHDFGITRKTVKRCVMTFAYSSEAFGFRQHIMEDLMDPMSGQVLQGELEKHPFGADKGWAAAMYIANLIYDCVKTIVAGAAEGMAYLQKAAGILAHESKGARWTTPMGLPVVNMYKVYEVKQIEVFLHDRKVPRADAGINDKLTKEGNVLTRVRMNLNDEPTDKIDKKKAKSTIAPNFIHSLDAAHLQATVNAAVSQGITDMLLIHDSFSTFACDTQQFQGVIKQAFVDMYANNDVIQQFHDGVLSDLSNEGQLKMPAVPAKGTLDIQGVLQSDYCFS